MSTSASYISQGERLKIDAQQWSALKWQIMCGLRVAAVGIVEKFDTVQQTVSVQVAIRENVLLNGVATPVAIDILQDVPVVGYRAGGFMVTLPIQQGDECLVVFADNCIDAWWQSGSANGPQNQVARRRHDLSDGVAVFGIWSQQRLVSAYSTNSLQIRSEDGNTMVEIAPSGVVNVKCATANVNATSQANVTAPTIDLNGNVNISGNLVISSGITVNGSATFNSTTVIEGRGFIIHQHGLVTPGTGSSGGVV